MEFTLHRFLGSIGRYVLFFLMAGLLLLAGGGAHAATTYTFPGNLPPDCSGSNGTYTCNSLSLNYQDAIVIASPKPATITVKNDFSTNQNQINAGGAAADLTFVVKGELDLNWNSSLNANVTASKIQTANLVVLGGNLSATEDIVLGENVHVPGSITSTAGQIQLGNNDTVDGNVTGALDVTIKYQSHVAGSVTSSSGQIQLENNVTVDGNVTAVKAVTIKYQGHVVGSVTSTSSQVQLENETVVGSITTGSDGAVDVKYLAVVCGDITTKAGSITLEQNNNVGGNVTSSSGYIKLGYQVHVRGSVSTHGGISKDSTSTVNDNGLSMPAACSASPSGGSPSGFNAFDTETAAHAVTGVIKTKVAGQTFTLAVVALTTTPTVKTDFEGNVVLQLVNSTGYTGANCSALGGIGSAGSISFTRADQGRVNATFTEDNAWPNVQVRMIYTPLFGSQVVACSTDAFAIRPAYFDVQVTDGDWETAGTTRALNNSAATGGTVHKAGRPFTISVTAKNAKGNTTSNYAGSPSPVLTQYVLPGSCAACVLSSSFSGSGGTVTSSSSSYNEVGVFKLQLQDAQYASIDATDGTTVADRTITSSEMGVGRFVPDHFTLQSSVVTPACTATAPGFTYMNQPALTIQYVVQAKNYGGSTTANYSTTSSDNLAQATVTLVAADNGTDLSSRLAGLGSPSWTSGEYRVNTAGASFTRLTAPDGPYNNLQLGITVTDPDKPVLETLDMKADGSACTTGTDCTARKIGTATSVRFGRLKLSNAYGTPKLNLPVPMRAEYYNGTTFVTNTLDSCTVVSKDNIAMPAYKGGVSAANMTVTGNVTTGGTFANGVGSLRLAKPNPLAAKKGSVDVCVDLGADVPVTPARCVATTPLALPWLKGRWTGNGYDDDPQARATFGIYRNSLGRGARMIYIREMY